MSAAVRMLGRFAVVVGDVDITPSAPKERALLALLALERGRVVSATRLADELWPGLDLPRARRGLQVRVANVRKLLSGGAGDAEIDFVDPGYRLTISPDAIDVSRFWELVALGRAHIEASQPDL